MSESVTVSDFIECQKLGTGAFFVATCFVFFSKVNKKFSNVDPNIINYVKGNTLA